MYFIRTTLRIVAILAISLNLIYTSVSLEQVCTDWVEPFWEFLTLGEARDAVLDDFERLFSAMDESSEGKVKYTEFKPSWIYLSSMTANDTKSIFDLMAKQEDTSDPESITDEDVKSIFNAFDTDNTGSVSKLHFKSKWKNDILPGLNDKGCPVSF